MTKIEDVSIIGVNVLIQGHRNSDEGYDFGALYLKLEDREYILDTVQTYWVERDEDTLIECALERDDDVFEDCKYDLDGIDVIDPNLEATFYVGGDFTNKIENITLYVVYNDSQIEIDVKQD